MKTTRHVLRCMAAVMTLRLWMPVMAEATTTSPTHLSLTTDPVVSLTDTEMSDITGGQSPGYEAACHLASIGGLASWQIGVDLAPLGPYLAGVGVVCQAVWIQGLIWENLTVPLAQDIYSVFAQMGGLDQFRHIHDISGNVGCANSVSTSDPSCVYQSNVIFQVSVEGDLSSMYCGGDGCWCDNSADCDGFLYCDGGYCVS